MKRLSAATQITIGITFLTLSLVLSAHGLGLLPSPSEATLEGRKALCESIAIQCSQAAARGDIKSISDAAEAILTRNTNIRSSGLRLNDGQLVVQTADHQQLWKAADASRSTPTHVRVPILRAGKTWATLEVCFKPLGGAGIIGWLTDPIVQMALFVAVVGFICYRIYLRKMLQHLDPSAVVPDRVKTMLNTLAEGVLILDRQERVVLANEAFAKLVGHKTGELQGIKASKLRWTQPQSNLAPEEFPWLKSLEGASTLTGIRIGLRSATDQTRTMRVNCMPILGGDNLTRGVLVTFDDVTTIEEKSARLRQMLEALQQSRDEINRQNLELQALATTDPLTGCMNRRSFFAAFETQWKSAKRYSHALSCIMVDVDHFKRINDRHGHSVGDQVLRHVAGLLKGLARQTDLVCRYGGEEFCVLLPQDDLESAAGAAERFRKQIEATACNDITVTASIGVSSIRLLARDPQELLDQADKALYAAKRSGRNRSMRWDQAPADFDSKPAHAEALREQEAHLPIPFHAVTALMSALGHRDGATADHCQRVADLCVSTAKGLMGVTDCFLLEVAAMLHDIGKLGVPDAILLKPGPLTQDEWKLMRTHDQMGVEIIAAAFGTPQLTEIVRTHHAWFAGNPDNPGLPTGQDIPLSARILSIADAFDAMTSERPYHRPKTRDAAFVELRRCAGKQFDPELVARLIETVSSRDGGREAPALSVPHRSALRIRLEIERLACALDERDLSMLSAMASRIAAVAAKDGLSEIATVATSLEKSVESKGDLESVLKMTNELLELCRSPQSLDVPVAQRSQAATAAA